MECEVEFLSRNRRYRILSVDDAYYIIDIEESVWTILIPFLFWWMPQKVYKADYKIVEKLKESTSDGNNLGVIFILGVGGSAVLSRILKPIMDFSMQTNVLSNIFLLIISTLIIINVRLYMRKLLGKRLSKLVDLTELNSRTIKLKPKYFRQYLVPVFIQLFFLIFIIALGFAFTQTSNFIGIFSFIVFLSLLSLCNTTTIHPNLGKRNLYRIIFS
ncbi:DUF443 domain-containing protein [Virgibacillus sp. MSJ-26]|uniref:DUF443 family protein n=1 Tax=Virgibacillus sp. MSJ-26 TaxID=2841522 RepID=UPI001C10A769|nr:DUF443 domain-containing protein [Virgibacillus sp. MSJ-26]